MGLSSAISLDVLCLVVFLRKCSGNGRDEAVALGVEDEEECFDSFRGFRQDAWQAVRGKRDRGLTYQSMGQSRKEARRL